MISTHHAPLEIPRPEGFDSSLPAKTAVRIDGTLVRLIRESFSPSISMDYMAEKLCMLPEQYRDFEDGVFQALTIREVAILTGILNVSSVELAPDRSEEWNVMGSLVRSKRLERQHPIPLEVAADCVGLTTYGYEQLERGNYVRLSFTKIIRLANLLGIPPEDLLSRGSVTHEQTGTSFGTEWTIFMQSRAGRDMAFEQPGKATVA